MGNMEGVLTVGDVRDAIRGLDDDAIVEIEIGLEPYGTRVARTIASEIAFGGKDALGFGFVTIKGQVRTAVFLDSPGIQELPKCTALMP